MGDWVRKIKTKIKPANEAGSETWNKPKNKMANKPIIAELLRLVSLVPVFVRRCEIMYEIRHKKTRHQGGFFAGKPDRST